MDIQKEVMNILLNNKNEKKVEEKEENELNLEDRLYLMSKNIDSSVKMQIYNNLIKNKNLLIEENSSQINDYVFNDVEFFNDHYSNENETLFDKINHCQTKVGSLLLEKIIKKPTNDITILKRRQDYIKKIQFIYDDLSILLNKIKTIENDIIWFWDESKLNHIDSMHDMIYFNWNFLPVININDKLNNSSEALLISNIYKIIISPILTCITPIITLITPLVLMLWFNKKMDSNISYKTIIYNYFKTLWSNDTMKLLISSPQPALLVTAVANP